MKNRSVDKNLTPIFDVQTFFAYNNAIIIFIYIHCSFPQKKARHTQSSNSDLGFVPRFKTNIGSRYFSAAAFLEQIP